MKISIIIVFVLVLIGVFIYRFFKHSDNTATSIGSIDDLESHIEKMMKSTMTGAFLIVKVYGTSDFIQFSGSERNVQLDFPLVTDRQKSMEAAWCTYQMGCWFFESLATRSHQH